MSDTEPATVPPAGVSASDDSADTRTDGADDTAVSVGAVHRDGSDADDESDDLLVREGDIAADYLERLLDIVDYDGDIDLDVENDRAVVAIVGTDLQRAGGHARRDAGRAAGADPARRRSSRPASAAG